jgi:hypothetical protein
VANEDDLAPAQGVPEVFDDGVQIGKVPGNGQLLRIGLRIERSAGAALVPIGDREVVLKIAVVIESVCPCCSPRERRERR